MTYGYIKNVFPTYKKEPFQNNDSITPQQMNMNPQNEHLQIMMHLLQCDSCNDIYKHKYSHMYQNTYNEIIILLLVAILVFLLLDRFK
jgi:hypothetical protein